MAGVSFDGIANLSPELQRAFALSVQAERKPIQALTEKKEKVDARLKLVNDVIGRVDSVKGLLGGLESTNMIRELTVGSSDANALTGTADKKLASPGTHNIEILQLPASASAVSNGFPDKDQTSVGTGFFSFTTAKGETKEFFIDDENSSLEGLARTINQARLGIRASVINDQTDPENPYRLVLVGDGTGEQNSIEYPDFYLMDGQEEFEIESERPGQNGIIRYEGHEFQVPNAEVPDLIPGVTINLKGVTEPGRPASITIGQDVPKTTEKIKTLVDKLNSVFTFIQEQNKMDEKTDTTKTLGGEFSLRMAEQRLRTVLTQSKLYDEGIAIRSLNDLGIQFQKTGLLKLDEKKFEAQLNANFDEVAQFLAGSNETSGIIPALNRTLQSISGPGAVLNSLKDVENDKDKRIQQDIERKEKLADKKQEDLKMRLSRMQSALSALQQQGANLAAQGFHGGMESLLQR